MIRNFKTLTVAAVLAVVGLGFAAGTYFQRQQAQARQDLILNQENTRLVRPHSPTFGPADAPVILVEFFDPACESCRAFYPHVKALLQQHPKEVRVVLRYAAFHPGSDQVVRLLEAARRQGKYAQVLENVLEDQPQWADHAQPNLPRVLDSARRAGLDMAQAEKDAGSPEVDAVLRQDTADVEALGIQRTPTFVVNGRGLLKFGPDHLAALVAEEIGKARATH